ncbi:MAG: hypothetical protein Q7K43_05785 [Candidatus Woesearchaeota archaeon]|nr:hypothetical protein [Candidatus Woesearchaeota archaeon]
MIAGSKRKIRRSDPLRIPLYGILFGWSLYAVCGVKEIADLKESSKKVPTNSGIERYITDERVDNQVVGAFALQRGGILERRKLNPLLEYKTVSDSGYQDKVYFSDIIFLKNGELLAQTGRDSRGCFVRVNKFPDLEKEIMTHLYIYPSDNRH